MPDQPESTSAPRPPADESGRSKWHRLADGIDYALSVHATQTRKGSDTPYISHLLAVAAIVLEFGGDEEQAIAAMLHDAIEDQGAHLEPEIGERFGPRVVHIVRGCTDADTVPKPPWRARKEAYIAHLASADPDVLLVSAADKLHNARAIAADLRTHGAAVFDRFRGGRDGTLWYYDALLQQFRRWLRGPLTDELAQAIGAMVAIAGLGPDDQVPEANTEWSEAEALNAHRGALSSELAQVRKDALVTHIKTLALERGPLNLHALDRATFWDDYSILLARDEWFGRAGYDEMLKAMCQTVLDGLSEFERRLLEQTTETYAEYWDNDAPELSGRDVSRWLRDEVLSSLRNQALNHGEDLIYGEDSLET